MIEHLKVLEKLMLKLTAMLLSLLFLLTACHWVYQPSIQQGNVITPAMLQPVKLGMTQAQVRYLLGTPLLINTFDANRWDYVYTMQTHSSKPIHEQKVTLWFKQGVLVKMTAVEEATLS
jgi:outer membrane protein assembly factor BamE